MIHRNTYINGPTVLRETWQTRTRDDLFFAGQISGVEGYVESAASGLIAGRNAAALARPSRFRRRRERRRSARSRTTCRTPSRGIISRRTSRSASCAPLQPTAGRKVPRKKAERNLALSDVRSPIWRLDAGDRARSAPTRDDVSRGPISNEQSQLADFLDHLRLNENASAHTVRAYESDLSQFITFVAAHLNRRRPICGRATSITCTSARSSATCTSAATRGRRRRGSSRRSARSGAICGVRAPSRGSRRARRHAEARAAAARAPRRSGDVAAARDARHLVAARPPRPGDPRAVLRVRAAPERTRRTRSRRCQSERPGGPRARARAARNGIVPFNRYDRSGDSGVARGSRDALRPRRDWAA